MAAVLREGPPSNRTVGERFANFAQGLPRRKARISENPSLPGKSRSTKAAENSAARVSIRDNACLASRANRKPSSAGSTRSAYSEEFRVVIDDEEHAILVTSMPAVSMPAVWARTQAKRNGWSRILASFTELRQQFPELPVIAISGVFQTHVLESAKALGAIDVLRKPITTEWNTAISRVRTKVANG